MASFKYYINETQYHPINEGDFTFDITLDTTAGAYQYVYSLNGSIVFDKLAYEYIKRHDKTQKILLTIRETSDQGTFVIFDNPLFFTHYDCEFSPQNKRVSIKPQQDSLFKCLTDGYDIKFNFLETPNVVSSTYSPSPSFLFDVLAGDFPFNGLFGSRVLLGGTVGIFFGFTVFSREIKTTYCQGGELQEPAGTGWVVEFDNCEGRSLAQWTRKPLVMGASNSLIAANFADTISATPPPITGANEQWLLMDAIPSISPVFWFWVDYNAIRGVETELTNGRLLIDVLNYGINKICPVLDVQSQILNNTVNPVTGASPSDMEGLQIHSISDIKDPNATEKASREDITVREILENYISGRANCYWRVDERTKRLIIEHYSDLNNQGIFDLNTYFGVLGLDDESYSYDKTDVPQSEEFPSLDDSIDFTGVDILFNNSVSSGKKTYNTDKFISEVESVITSPDSYPNDGVVIITPESLAPLESIVPSGARAENGAITGEYYPNAPQAMANMQEKYFQHWRPFEHGNMNFTNRTFLKNKPVIKAAPISVPLCSFYFFNPYAKFIGLDFIEGQLQTASFSPKTGRITINTQHNE
jgi:hypothetical protein